MLLLLWVHPSVEIRALLQG
uniref:Uncharacterized protein n=1 Tax=Anguilla anguilla TaxID=7936 RepID=A0A0E9U296_ANGAN